MVIIDVDACIDATASVATTGSSDNNNNHNNNETNVVETYYPIIAPPKTIPLGERMKQMKRSKSKQQEPIVSAVVKPSSTVTSTTNRKKKKKSVTMNTSPSTTTITPITTTSADAATLTVAGTPTTSSSAATTTAVATTSPTAVASTTRTKMLPSYNNKNNSNNKGGTVMRGTGAVTALARYHSKMRGDSTNNANNNNKKVATKLPQRTVLHATQSNLATIEEGSINSNDTESIHSLKSGKSTSTPKQAPKLLEPIPDGSGHSSASSKEEELLPNVEGKSLLPAKAQRSCTTTPTAKVATKKSTKSITTPKTIDSPTAPVSAALSTSVTSTTNPEEATATTSTTTNAKFPTVTSLLQRHQQSPPNQQRRRSSMGGSSTSSSIYLNNSTTKYVDLDEQGDPFHATNTPSLKDIIDNNGKAKLQSEIYDIDQCSNMTATLHPSLADKHDHNKQARTGSINSLSSLFSSYGRNNHNNNYNNNSAPTASQQHPLDTYSCTSSTMTPKVRNKSVPSSSTLPTSTRMMMNQTSTISNSAITRASTVVNTPTPTPATTTTTTKAKTKYDSPLISSLPENSPRSEPLTVEATIPPPVENPTQASSSSHHRRIPVNVDDDIESNLFQEMHHHQNISNKDLDVTNESTANSDDTVEDGAEMQLANKYGCLSMTSASMRHFKLSKATSQPLENAVFHQQQPQQSSWKKLRCILSMLLVLLISCIIILSTSVAKNSNSSEGDRSGSNNNTMSISSANESNNGTIPNNPLPAPVATTMTSAPVVVSATSAPIATNVPTASPTMVTVPIYTTSTPTTAFPVVDFATGMPTTLPPGNGVSVTMIPSAQETQPGNGNVNKTTESNGQVIYYSRRVPVKFLNCGGPTLNMITTRSTVNSKGETIVKNITRVWESDHLYEDYLIGRSNIFSKGHIESCHKYVLNSNETNDSTISVLDDRNMDALYCSERYFTDGIGGYEIPVMTTTPGYYRIELYFMESYYSSDDDRLFNIVIEDFVQQSNYSIFKKARGQNIKASVINTVYVSDQSISISLESVVNRPMLNAMAIYYLSQE